MRELAGLLTPSFARALALALIHFLWQGALVALLLATFEALAARTTARIRYAVSCAALGLLLALPVATFLRYAAGTIQAAPVAAAAAVPASAPNPVAAAVPTAGSVDPVTRLAPWIVVGWLAGVSALSLRLFGGGVAAARLKRRRTRAVASEWDERLSALARRLRLSQPVRLLESALVNVPTAVGVLRPVILLPAGLLTGLTPDQLDALLAHELAHIRRRDCLVNLLQALAETLLFYHPAVWWVSNRIRVERENVCDDLAVAVTGDAVTYARALVRIAERRNMAPRLAVAADGGRLWNRVARLFPAPETEGGRTPRWLAAAIALGATLAVGAAVQLPPPNPEARPAVLSARGTTSAAQIGVLKAAWRQEKAEQTPATPRKRNATPAPPAPAGKGLLSPQQLIAFRIHDVTPEFIEKIAALGYQTATPDELVALRIHGATPEYIAQMTAIFGKRPLEEYAAFRIHGLTPESLKQLEAQFGKLSADDALAMRIHGVDAAFVKSFRDAGYTEISPDEVLALRIHGVTPEFVKEMRSLGLPEVSLDDALAFRIHGVTPEYVREIRSLGYASLDADELTAFRIHGVTPEYIRRMNQRLGGRLSADELIDVRNHTRRNEVENDR